MQAARESLRTLEQTVLLDATTAYVNVVCHTLQAQYEQRFGFLNTYDIQGDSNLEGEFTITVMGDWRSFPLRQ